MSAGDDQLVKEKREMQRRMTSNSGHLLIQLARCIAKDPDHFKQAFPEIHPSVEPILHNLDPQIILLIADTPIIVGS